MEQPPHLFDGIEYLPLKWTSYQHLNTFFSILVKFCSEVISKLETILDFNISKSPSVFLLGDLPPINASKETKIFIFTSSIIAKIVILLNWKDRTKIYITQWFNLYW